MGENMKNFRLSACAPLPCAMLGVPMARNLLIVWLINALALLALPYPVPSVQVDSIYTALVAALLLGFVNTLIRPLLVLLTLPATVLTLGLFIFVINGLLFWFVASFVKGFSVEGFWSAFFGAIVYALVSWAASALVFGPPRIVVVRHEERRPERKAAISAQRGAKHEICPLCALFSSSR